jgi:hypothetical protein
VGSLERRLKVLEGSRAEEECRVCGLDPRVPVTDLEVVWNDVPPDGRSYDDEDERRYEDEDVEEYCYGCGRQMTYVVEWRDIANPAKGWSEMRQDRF